jgi:transcriptional regulator with XRE-family HTH domain
MQDYLPLSDQLNLLFETVPHPDGRPYTLQEVSEATGVSAGTLSQMRVGHSTNPQLSTLRALGHFFQVPLRYFETRSSEECYALLSETPPPPPAAASEIAFRASSLSTQSQRDILTIIKWVQSAEQQRQQGEDLPPLPGLVDDDEETPGD